MFSDFVKVPSVNSERSATLKTETKEPARPPYFNPDYHDAIRRGFQRLTALPRDGRGSGRPQQKLLARRRQRNDKKVPSGSNERTTGMLVSPKPKVWRFPCHLGISVPSTVGGLLLTFITWTPSLFADFTSFVNLFDMFRCTGMEVELIPVQSAVTQGAPAALSVGQTVVFALASFVDTSARTLAVVASADTAKMWSYRELQEAPVRMGMQWSKRNAISSNPASTTDSLVLGTWYDANFTGLAAVGGITVVSPATVNFGVSVPVFEGRLTAFFEFCMRE